MNNKEAKSYIESLKSITDFFQTVNNMISIPTEYIDKNHDYFSTRAAGDGMAVFGIDEGDTLIFEVSDTIASGEIGMFIYGEEHTSVCRIYKEYENGNIFLLGDPNLRQPIQIMPGEQNFHVIGKLTTIMKDVRNKTY